MKRKRKIFSCFFFAFNFSFKISEHFGFFFLLFIQIETLRRNKKNWEKYDKKRKVYFGEDKNKAHAVNVCVCVCACLSQDVI